jgi:hypothetical protein
VKDCTSEVGYKTFGVQFLFHYFYIPGYRDFSRCVRTFLIYILSLQSRFDRHRNLCFRYFARAPVCELPGFKLSTKEVTYQQIG